MIGFRCAKSLGESNSEGNPSSPTTNEEMRKHSGGVGDSGNDVGMGSEERIEL